MAGQSKNKPLLIDLFAGCGGMSEGFKQAGFHSISAVEINSVIATTLSKNHPETLIFNQDITSVNTQDLLTGYKSIDVVAGGPPCQGFSMAGKRIRNGGIFLNDPRNNLFREFYRVVTESLPKVFVMENVPGILTINNGEIRDLILRLFLEIGYKTSVQVLLAAEYGVPQLRKRAFFIGTRLDIDPKDLFPLITHSKLKGNFVTVEDAIFDLPILESGEGSFEMEYDKQPFSAYQKLMRKKSKLLFNHIAPNHDFRVIEILKLIKEGEGMKNLPKKFHTKSVHSGAYGRLDRNKPSYTITTRFDTPPVGRVTHPKINRALSPREAARLQSFDDNYIFYGNKTSIGIQIGNAVPPLLSKAIATQILFKLNTENLRSDNFQHNLSFK